MRNDEQIYDTRVSSINKFWNDWLEVRWCRLVTPAVVHETKIIEQSGVKETLSYIVKGKLQTDWCLNRSTIRNNESRVTSRLLGMIPNQLHLPGSSPCLQRNLIVSLYSIVSVVRLPEPAGKHDQSNIPDQDHSKQETDPEQPGEDQTRHEKQDSPSKLARIHVPHSPQSKETEDDRQNNSHALALLR